MDISATMVKELRDRTGAGMMDCKKALVEASGDLEKAADLIIKKGLAKAAKKQDRAASEGLVHSYIHPGGRIGVLLEVNCETDFVARTSDFQAFVEDVSLQIAANAPVCVRREEIPAELVAKQREIFEAQVRGEGKPDKIVPKIVDGKIDKWYQEVCLLEQPFVKNPDQTVEQIRTTTVSKTGENIQVRRFVRFELGEGLARPAGDA